MGLVIYKHMQAMAVHSKSSDQKGKDLESIYSICVCVCVKAGMVILLHYSLFKSTGQQKHYHWPHRNAKTELSLLFDMAQTNVDFVLTWPTL